MYIMVSTVLRRVSGPVRRVSRMLTRYLEISGSAGIHGGYQGCRPEDIYGHYGVEDVSLVLLSCIASSVHRVVRVQGRGVVVIQCLRVVFRDHGS